MDIKRHLSLVWRRAWLIILGAIIAGATAYLISSYTTPVYRASARLLIDEPPGDANSEYNQVLLEQRLALTYVEIIKMRSILVETILRLDLPFSPSQLQEMVSVSALRDTQIIDVSVEDTDPGRAATIANTIGEVFIEQNQERESLRYAEPAANWNALIGELGNEIEKLEIEINAFGPTQTVEEQAALSQLETKLSELQARYGDAVNQLNQLLVEQAKQSSNVVQLELARANYIPVRPKIIANTVVAALAGAMVALGVIFLLDYLDDSIKEPEQIQQVAGLSTLGALAEIKDIDTPGKLVTFLRPRDQISEAYRKLRTNLSYAAVNGGLRSVLVTSPMPKDGKSTMVANLGVVFAQSGMKILVVDADLRRPVQHIFFSLKNETGLTTAILKPQPSAYHYSQETSIADLRVLTSGPIPPNPAELLGSRRMGEVLEELVAEVDLVLIDTPPSLSVTDAVVLAPKTAGCLLLVNVGQTKRDALHQAVTALESSGTHLYGAVLNMVKPSHGYYRYYYYERQQNEYDEKYEPDRLVTEGES